MLANDREANVVNPTRRTFLGTSAALAAGAALAADQPPASEKLVVALIGCGGQGRGDLRAFLRLPEIEVAALCDVDRAHIDNAAKDVEKAGRPTARLQLEQDFHRVLERKDIDAVVVATPDHWPAYVLLAACASGKDAYVEKPPPHNAAEGRALTEQPPRTSQL